MLPSRPRFFRDRLDESGANTTAFESYNTDQVADNELRRCKYLNNIVEPELRVIKRIAQPMLGFKSFRYASILISGIEITHLIRKGQMPLSCRAAPSAARQLYSLAS